MSKIRKDERIRRLALAAELEAVQGELEKAETFLASVTASVNKIICGIVENDGRKVKKGINIPLRKSNA